MNLQTFHRQLAQFLAALYLALAAGPGVTLILCSERSGRQNVESALSEDHCVAAASNTAARNVYESGQCGCTDTPLLQKATLKGSNITAPPPSHVALVASVPSARGLLASHRSPGRAGPSAEPAVRVLRTVVLLV